MIFLNWKVLCLKFFKTRWVHEVPFTSEAAKRSSGRTENVKCTNVTNRISRVGYSTPFYNDRRACFGRENWHLVSGYYTTAPGQWLFGPCVEGFSTDIKLASIALHIHFWIAHIHQTCVLCFCSWKKSLENYVGTKTKNAPKKEEPKRCQNEVNMSNIKASTNNEERRPAM